MCWLSCCSDRVCSEWKAPTYQLIFYLRSLLGVIIAAFYITAFVFLCLSFATPAVFTLISLQITWMVLFVVNALCSIAVYAPYQSQLFPRWYKIGTVVWYALWSTAIYAAMDALYPSDGANGRPANDAVLNMWTVGYVSNALILAWLVPYAWGVGGFIVMYQVWEFVCYWQLLRLLDDPAADIVQDRLKKSILFTQYPRPVNPYFQLMTVVLSALAYTLAVCVFMRVQNKSFKTEFPWISARATVAAAGAGADVDVAVAAVADNDTRKHDSDRDGDGDGVGGIARWCCEACFVKCWRCCCCGCGVESPDFDGRGGGNGRANAVAPGSQHGRGGMSMSNDEKQLEIAQQNHNKNTHVDIL